MAMEEINDAMKPLAAIAKKQAPFDAAVVKASATTIADNLKKAAAVALQSVADEAGFRPALGALGGNCKACHDKYRLPPKQQ